MPAPVITFPPIPAETAQAVGSVFGKGNIYVMIGDQLDRLFATVDLAQLNRSSTKPRYILLVYGLVTLFQFMECLPDRRAAAALHSRLDWKYALHLPLNHPGMTAYTLCEFRRQVWHDPIGQQTFQKMIDAVADHGWLLIDARPRPTAGELIASVCNLSRIEQLADGLCVALETLAANRPDWLLKTVLPHWYDRYTKRLSLSDLSNATPDQLALAQTIGLDAAHLLDAIDSEPSLAELSEIQALQRIYA